ncbi:Dolichyl-phosphate-mannose-protein mannosyltransferase [Butyrivibrio hungatei DSM 14810]|uniref:Dolichyl-phosphate-mannose-protein mannosyltransferase n=1 Tax=Butyrivibrio hungatei DSM 14810 TaxID=1121132 RepID=A0A1M7S3N8_9FIRM|nr:glycosyltransferase family 39 protein [Butyrivibrio hungatei]SHN53041.1 Dolichyl-phosphate-mannose-protein mannosyltransferase [Butyrivibrio hungatei DSM 14810]
MRIIDYYNYIATAACIFTGAAAVIICKKNNMKDLSARATTIILAVIMFVAAFLRLYRLGAIPYGLHQDEASLGYEAYSLATYGIDRNGYPFPVYPITWGCGGGSPLMIYLNAISIRLFGSGVVKLRLIPAISGIITVFLFYLVVKELTDNAKAAHKNMISLFAAFFLAVCPWHVILSRWSLDANIMPLNMCISMYLFMLGIRTKKTYVYVLSAIAYAICMYSYGSATIVVPIHLLLLCVFCLKNKLLNIKQLIASGVAFLVVFAPLLIFYMVNYLGLPEVFAEHFTINRFTASRSGEVFIALDSSLPANLFNNLKVFFKVITIGDDTDMLCHFIPGYATLFEFTFPITFIGIYVTFKDVFSKKSKDSAEKRAIDFVWLSMLIACFIMALVIVTDISRMVMMFLPLIYFFVKGFGFVLERTARVGVLIPVLLLFAAISFSKDYFLDYNNVTGNLFMPGYGEAIERAYEIAGDERPIYSTYDGLSAPFMLALYYNDYDVNRFYKTVNYKDPYGEFRVADSFGNFIFGLPQDIDNADADNAVFVLSESEFEAFHNADSYLSEHLGGYCILHKH